MRSSTLSLAILGLGIGGAIAAPVAGDSQDDRFVLGNPTTGVRVDNPSGNPCNHVDATRGFCVISGPIKPSPKGRRQLIQLPSDPDAAKKEAIKRIQLQIQELERKKDLSPEEARLLLGLKFALEELTGIKYQNPPDGGSTILIPGKRDLEERQLIHLPPGDDAAKKEAIKQIQLQIQALQKKKNRTKDEEKLLKALKEALKELTGIISQDPGDGDTILIPGKRDAPLEERQTFTLPPDPNADLKEAIKQIQLQIQALERKKKLTKEEQQLLKSLKFALQKLTGIKEQVPPGDGSTILIPGRKRSEKSPSAPPRGPGCLDKLAAYFEDVNAFLGQFFDVPSRTTIWSYIVNEALRNCMGTVGGLKPDPTTPGSPIKPDPVQSGSPLKPGK